VVHNHDFKTQVLGGNPVEVLGDEPLSFFDPCCIICKRRQVGWGFE